ncbi:hypothetical protein G9A89_023498 [Geosiphon pyriformis]|nr:hypothetical protein G9A89_023498 [Geosiphon pyriformis]
MNSNNFAVISRNVEKVPPYLDQICSPPNNLNQCNEIMSSYGAKMTEGSNCRVDIQNQNPIATEAYVAFYTYQLYQDVGCAKNSSNTYCYVDALDRKLGLGIYYLPSGTQLASPKDQFPCSECNKKILNTFSEYAGDTALPLSDTFEPVRNYFNSYCGEDFIKKASAIHVSKLATSSASSLYSRLRKRSIDFPTITRIVLMITIPLFLLDIRL